jgi:tetratricopeptide (TPR) repeat protein
VALDPQFGEAWALLAIESIRWWDTNYATDPDMLTNAERALGIAVRLIPNTPELLFAESHFLFYEKKDIEGCIRRLLEVIAIAPNFNDAKHFLSTRSYHLGRFTEAENYAQAALRADPLLTSMQRLLGLIYMRVHDWERASQHHLERAGIANSESVSRRLQLLASYLRGNTEDIINELQEKDDILNELWYWAFGDAEGVVNSIPVAARERYGELGSIYLLERSPSWRYVLARYISGHEEAQASLMAYRDRFQLKVDSAQNSFLDLSRLGLVQAVLGEEEASMDSFKQAKLLVNEQIAPGDAVDLSVDHAIALAWLGHKAEAVAEFDRLIKGPSMLNVNFMRTCLDFWPLRDHPGFQAILDDPANSLPLDMDKL